MAPQPQYPQNLQELPCFRCTFTQEFHDHVLEALTELGMGQKAIIGRLDKINGSVAELFRRTNSHGEQIAVLNKGSADVQDLEKRMKQVEDRGVTNAKAIAEASASQQGASRVRRAFEPIIWMGISLVLFLILQHGSDLAKAVLARGH